MYKEKKLFMEHLSKVNKEYSLGWDYNYMNRLSSAMSMKLDQHRFLTHEDFLELLEHNYGNPEDYKDIDFDDEVINIEEVHEEELVDIEVSEDNLFYANGILTHNSAYDNVEAGLETVSDSIGLVQTADNFIFIINSDQMKENNQLILKFGKNRNTGQLSSLMLETDFSHMRFTDWDDDQVTAKDSIPNFNQDDSFMPNSTLDTSSFNF